MAGCYIDCVTIGSSLFSNINYYFSLSPSILFVLPKLHKKPLQTQTAGVLVPVQFPQCCTLHSWAVYQADASYFMGHELFHYSISLNKYLPYVRYTAVRYCSRNPCTVHYYGTSRNVFYFRDVSLFFQLHNCSLRHLHHSTVRSSTALYGTENDDITRGVPQATFFVLFCYFPRGYWLLSFPESLQN